MSHSTPYEQFLAKKTKVRIKKLSKARNNMQQFSIHKAKAIPLQDSLVTNFQQQDIQHPSQIKYDLIDYLNNKKLDNYQHQITRSNHLSSFLTPVMKVKSQSRHNPHHPPTHKPRIPNALWTLDPQLTRSDFQISKILSPQNIHKISQQCPKFCNSTIRNRVNSRKKMMLMKVQASEIMNHSEVNSRVLTEVPKGEEEFEDGVEKFLTAKYADSSWVKLEGIAKRRKRSVLAFTGLRNSDIRPWEIQKQAEGDSFYE